jgi:hypothetical protein
MYRCFPLFLALALPAFAAEPVGVAEFEAFATGKTLTYAVGGTVYGAEQYLPGRRVIWAFKGQQCRKGLWYEEAGQVCFVYEDDPAAQCWTFSRDGDGLLSGFTGDPEGAEPVRVQEGDPLTCAGPDLGV